MKTSHQLFALTCLTISMSAFAQATGEGPKTPAEIAELGLHKLERLTAGANPRVEKSFQSQTVEITIEANPDGTFTASYLQGAAADGTRKTARLSMIDTGSVTGYVVTPASAPANPVSFPVLNALTLMENSLHCIEGENVVDSQICANTPELKVFKQKLSRAVMSPVKDGTGATVGASVEIYGVGLPEKVIVTLKANGSLSDQNPVQFIKL